MTTIITVGAILLLFNFFANIYIMLNIRKPRGPKHVIFRNKVLNLDESAELDRYLNNRCKELLKKGHSSTGKSPDLQNQM